MSGPAKTKAGESPKIASRPTIWYSIEAVVEESECPSCGRPMKSFKNRPAHVKKCFAIRKLGPVYRLHGYAECKCGLLIADTPKAKKLHVCLGTIPDFNPNVSYEPPPMPAKPPAPPPAAKRSRSPQRTQKPEKNPVLQAKSKIWVRNFSSPIRPKGVLLLDDSCFEAAEPQPRPRVRNFDKPHRSRSPDEVSVYSIIRQNGSIVLTGRSVLRQRGDSEKPKRHPSRGS
ncbi:hypothetical protein KR018_002975 [Drosophila ironensis]|nr:hypothetical protein KR018_002975 [Drosophila ironensis]